MADINAYALGIELRIMDASAKKSIQDLQEELAKLEKRFAGAYSEDILSSFKQSQSAILATQKQMSEGASVYDILSSMGTHGTQLANAFRIMASRGAVFASVLALLAKGIKAVSYLQDQYSRVTHRALGTQLALIKVSNNLRATLGVTVEEAAAAVNALASAGFRATHEIEALAEANIMFSHATGVSAEATADYQRQMVAITGSADDTTKSLAIVSNAIRKGGLSAGEANQLVKQLSETLFLLGAFYAPEAAKGVSAELARLSATFKAAGGDAQSALNQMKPLLESPLGMTIAMAKLGVAMDNYGNMATNVRNYTRAAFEEIKRLDEAGIGPLAQEAVLAARGLDKNFVASMKRTYQEVKRTGGGIDDMLNAMGKGADLQRDWNEAMSTLTNMLKRLVEPILTVGATLAELIVPAITILLKPIAMLASLVGKLATGLREIPIIGELASAALGLLALRALGVSKAFQAMSVSMLPMLGKIPGLGKLLGAGGILGGGGRGMMTAVMGLARAHPIIAAIVAAVVGALVVVPKLFEVFDKGNIIVKAFIGYLLALMAPLVSLYIVLRTVWTVIKAVYEVIRDALLEAFETMSKAWEEAFGSGMKTISIMGILNKVFSAIAGAVKIFMKPISLFIKAIGHFAAATIWWMKILWERIKENPITKFIIATIEAVKDLIDYLSDADAVAKKTDLGKPLIEAADAQIEALQAVHNAAQEYGIGMAVTPVTPAEPVRQAVLPEPARIERKNEDVIRSNQEVRDVLNKINERIGMKGMNELVDLLKKWLPKIAEAEQRGGFGSIATQWM